MVLITESFSGPPDLKPDHQILRDGGPVVHCLKMLILSPAKSEQSSCYIVCPFSYGADREHSDRSDRPTKRHLHHSLPYAGLSSYNNTLNNFRISGFVLVSRKIMIRELPMPTVGGLPCNSYCDNT